MGNIQLLVWVVNVFGKIGLDKIVKAVEMLQPSVGILVPVNFGCHGVMKTFHSPKEPSNFLVLLNVHHSFVTYSLHITRYCCRTLWGDGYACTTHALKKPRFTDLEVHGGHGFCSTGLGLDDPAEVSNILFQGNAYFYPFLSTSCQN